MNVEKMNFWVGDRFLEFGKPIWNGTAFVRNKYLYFGQSHLGALEINEITLEGDDASYFTLESLTQTVSSGDCGRLRVKYASPSLQMYSNTTRIRLTHSDGISVSILIRVPSPDPISSPTDEPSSSPSEELSSSPTDESPSSPTDESPSSPTDKASFPINNPPMDQEAFSTSGPTSAENVTSDTSSAGTLSKIASDWMTRAAIMMLFGFVC